MKNIFINKTETLVFTGVLKFFEKFNKKAGVKVNSIHVYCSANHNVNDCRM